MTAADDLRALSAAATEGPWTISHRHIHKTEMDDESCGLGLEIDQWDEPMRGHISRSADARLTVWCRNHADALADLIDAASALAEPAGWWRGVEQRQEHQLLDRRAVVRDALAALEADQ